MTSSAQLLAKQACTLLFPACQKVPAVFSGCWVCNSSIPTRCFATDAQTTSESSTAAPPSPQLPYALQSLPVFSPLAHKPEPHEVPVTYKNNPPNVFPWTFTRLLFKRPRIDKRMRGLMAYLEQERLDKMKQVRQYPRFEVGDVLELRMVVPEANGKEYICRGVCVKKTIAGIRTTFKIYNVFPDVGGFIQVFPLYMPDMLEIKVVGRIHTEGRKLSDLLEEKDQSKYMFQSGVMPVRTKTE